MRFFELLNNQHILIYLIPSLLFMIVFGVSLAFSHFYSPQAEERKLRIIKRYIDDIEDRDAPFPFGMFLIILGTVLWALFYILGYGIFKVVI